jgi:asparagine synthase (glutamine-hydrolysing)
MCGINGIFSFKNKEEAVQQVRRMNQCIAHRGPDSEGIWANENCVLGHRRLSIIDTSEAGNQPFFSADKKLSMVYNGEIYNYIELKQELSSEFTFTTASDTEVIIAAYKKWGIKCIEKFFGMFAFALWDEDLQALFVVRDRLGVKPLYYSQQNSQLIFSSETSCCYEHRTCTKKNRAKIHCRLFAISNSACAEYHHRRCKNAHARALHENYFFWHCDNMLLGSGKKCDQRN